MFQANCFTPDTTLILCEESNLIYHTFWESNPSVRTTDWDTNCTEFLYFLSRLYHIPYRFSMSGATQIQSQGTPKYLILCGSRWIRTNSARRQQFYRLPQLSNSGVLPYMVIVVAVGVAPRFKSLMTPPRFHFG